MRPAIVIATALGFGLFGEVRARDNDTVQVVGIGWRSCASWLENTANRSAGGHWIGGFWTGLNVFNPRDRSVGHTVNAEGIFSEVEKVCREHPSMPIATAARQVYGTMAEQHR